MSKYKQMRIKQNIVRKSYTNRRAKYKQREQMQNKIAESNLKHKQIRN